MKKKFIFLSLVVLLISNTSCLPQKEYKADPDPFTPMFVQTRSYDGIDNPKLAWIYTWEDKKTSSYDKGMKTPPATDDKGNVYFINQDYQISSISSSGNLLWTKGNGIRKMQILNNEILINTSTFRTRLLSMEDRGLVLNESGIEQYGFELYSNMGPDGFFYNLIRKKDDKKIVRDSLKREWDFRNDYISNLYSFDAKQKIRWIYVIPQTSEEYRTLEKCFFDEKGNIYFVISVTNSKRCIEIFSLTNMGRFRWKKEFLSESENFSDFSERFIDFIPDQFIFKDVFLIRIKNYPSEKEKEINKIVCISSEGQELWSNSIYKKEHLSHSYCISKDELFYFSVSNSSTEKTFLLAISMSGKKLWEKELIGEATTTPILDEDGNIYIGSNSGYYSNKLSDRYLYSFTPSGQLRWNMLQQNPSQSFDNTLVLGPNRRIYYGCYLENVLFCIENED